MRPCLVTFQRLDCRSHFQCAFAWLNCHLSWAHISALQCCLFAIIFSSFAHSSTRLTLWHGQGANEAFWQSAVDDFNRITPGVFVEVSSISRKELNSTLTFAVMNNESPDMVLLQSDLLGLKSLFKIAPVPEHWLASSVPQEVRNFVILDNTLYGIPISYGNHMVLFYNKKLVTTPATSWDELLEQRLSLPTGVEILAINYRSSYSFVTFWHAFGDELIVDGRINLKNSGTVDALNFYRNIASSKMLDATCDYSCVTEDFYAGRYAYAINGDWGYENAKQKLGDDLGVAQLPALAGKRLMAMKSSLVLAFPNDALRSEARSRSVKLFSDYIQSRAFATRIYQELHTLPAHSEVIQLLRQKDDPAFQALLKQLDNSIPMPTSVAMITAWDSIRKGFKMFIEEHISAETAAAYMQKKADYEREKVQQRERE